MQVGENARWRAQACRHLFCSDACSAVPRAIYNEDLPKYTVLVVDSTYLVRLGHIKTTWWSARRALWTKMHKGKHKASSTAC